jgi:hypothetical protein
MFTDTNALVAANPAKNFFRWITPTMTVSSIASLLVAATRSTSGWLGKVVHETALGFFAATATSRGEDMGTALTKKKNHSQSVSNLVSLVVSITPANSLQMRYLWLE